MERRINVKISAEQHKAVRVKAAELGVSISNIVRDLLRLWVAGEVSLGYDEQED